MADWKKLLSGFHRGMDMDIWHDLGRKIAYEIPAIDIPAALEELKQFYHNPLDESSPKPEQDLPGAHTVMQLLKNRQVNNRLEKGS